MNVKRIFGSVSFYKAALSIALPIMLQQLIQSLVSLVDNFMVSGLGDVSMSGVNIAGQILFVFLIFTNTICMTGGIFLTQFFGAKERSGMQQAFSFKLIMGLLVLIPYFMVCLAYPKQILSLLVVGNTQADAIISEGVRYIRIMSLVGIPMTFSICIASSLRDMGKVRLPLAVTVVATLSNTVCNYIMIYGHFGIPAMGVRGAAFATVIARTLEFLIFAVIYMKIKPQFGIWLSEKFRIDVVLFREMLKKGALVLFCEMTWAVSETIITAIYNGRGGADVVSGMAASFAIANLFFVAFNGICTTTVVLIGKTLGEGELSRARQEKTWLLSGSAVFGVMMTLFGMVTTLAVPIVYARLSVNAIDICRRMVILLSLFMPIWVYMNTQMSVARAGGDTKMGACVDASINIIVMLPMLFMLARYTGIGPVEMYLCVKLLDIIKIVIFQFWMKKERWLRNLTVEHE
ncbi:MATE family efflux transporter [Oribacterium sp. WCC10]|uniref:MATE family efflux transporter n=1 Tax=Oribacterium sp. WCC10 TaxID=1855343 RepID=UPI0008E1EC30|nr:MATE family efflux transporter [Oribacterium sp. WCC10]SFG83826.1 putative efflux protein, MATE family [Oribacterium sp. WCC10]